MGVNSGNSTKSNTSMHTPRGLSQHSGIATKETGLSVSGSVVYDKVYLVARCPAFTTAAGNIITFSEDGHIDLRSVMPGDIFEDNTTPTPVSYTVESVDASDKALTLSSTPTILTAGGKIYRNKTVNALAVMGYNHSGSTTSGMDVNLYDEDGQPFTFENPLPVQLSQGSINVENMEIDEVLVHLDHEDRDIVDYRGGWQSAALPLISLDIDYTANLSFVDNSITYAPGANITFQDNSPAADTISDSLNGFIVAGFTAGDTIVVTGSVSNDGTYTIAAGGVAAGVLTLEATDELTDEAVAVAATIYTNTPQDTITDAANQFVVEGFQDGMTISISGTASNDGDYTIDTVAVGTLTLISGDSLTTEGPVATTVTCTSSKMNVNVNGDGAQEIELDDYALLNSGLDIAAAIQARVRDLTAYSAANQAAIDNFVCLYDSTATMYKMWSGSWEGTSSVAVTAATTGDVATYLKLTAAAGATAITEPNTHTVEGDSTRIGDGTDLMNVVIEDEDISSFDGGILQYGESVTQTAKKFQCVEDSDSLGAGEDKGHLNYFKSAPIYYSSTMTFADADPDTITDASSGFLKAGFREGMSITVSGTVSNNGTFTIASVTAAVITLVVTDSLTNEAVACNIATQPEMADTFNVAHQGELIQNYGRGLVVYGRDVNNHAKTPEIVLDGGDLDGEAGDDAGFIMYHKAAGATAALRDIATPLHIATEDVDISSYDNGILIYGESVGQTAKMWQVLEEADVMAAGEDKGILIYCKTAATLEADANVASALHIAMQGDPLATYSQGPVIYGRDLANNAKTLELIEDGGDLDAEAGDDAGFLSYFKSAGATAALKDIASTLHIATEDVDISTYDNGVIIYGEAVDQTAKKLQIVEQDDVMAAGEDKGILAYFKSAGSGGDQPEVAKTLNIASQGDDISTNDLGAVIYGRKIDDTATVPVFVEEDDSISGAGDDAGTLIYGESVTQTAKMWQVLEDGDNMEAGEDKGIIVYGKSAEIIYSATLSFVDSNPDTITDAANQFVAKGFLPGMQITVSGTVSNDGVYTIATVAAGTLTLIPADILTGEALVACTITGNNEAADTFNIAHQGESIATYGRGLVIYGRDINNNAKTLEIVEEDGSIAGAGDDGGILIYGESVGQTAKIPMILEDADALDAGEDKGFMCYFKSATATPEVADTLNIAFEGEAIGTNGRGVVIYGRDTSDNAKTLELNAAGELTVSSSNTYSTETVSVTLSTGAKTIIESPLPYGKVSIHYVWSGLDAIDSNIVVQVSNDNTNWQNLPIGVTNLNVAASNEMVFSQDIPYAYIRLYYTVGTVTAGTINAYVCFKSS